MTIAELAVCLSVCQLDGTARQRLWDIIGFAVHVFAPVLRPLFCVWVQLTGRLAESPCPLDGKSR